MAPLKVRLRTGKFREPDIIFLRRGKFASMGNQFWDAADLAMEVVSDDNRDHDLKKNRRENALAGIPGYWIVAPQNSTITVLELSPQNQRKSYIVHGRFAPGAMATSKTLAGFEVDVAAVFSQQP